MAKSNLSRNSAIIDKDVPKWDAFFARHADLFDWQRPDGSSSAFPRYKFGDGVDPFCTSLVDESGALFLPSTIYSSELGLTPNDRLRLGFGRSDLIEELAALDAHFLLNAARTGFPAACAAALEGDTIDFHQRPR